VTTRVSNALHLTVIEQEQGVAPAPGVRCLRSDRRHDAGRRSTGRSARASTICSRTGGAGTFTIARTDPKNTPDILCQGNLVKVKVGGVYRTAFFLEEHTDTVLSEEEGGGEVAVWGGRSAKAYLETTEVYPPVWPPKTVQVRGVMHGDNGTGGTSLDVTRAHGYDGDILWVFLLIAGGSDVGTLTHPTGFAQQFRQDDGTDWTLICERRYITTGDAGTYPFSWAGSRRASFVSVLMGGGDRNPEDWVTSLATNAASTDVKAPASTRRSPAAACSTSARPSTTSPRSPRPSA